MGDHFWLFVHKFARKENLNLADKSLVADFSAKSIFHCIKFTYDVYEFENLAASVASIANKRKNIASLVYP